ncbi:MAG: hypothetical protein HY356_04660 [Gammaproteobacteria bacterium]|nr:hypothetical protein [Gammaproteobacteria bacterium]
MERTHLNNFNPSTTIGYDTAGYRSGLAHAVTGGIISIGDDSIFHHNQFLLLDNCSK